MKALRTLIGLGAIGVLIGWALPQPVQADSVADFYKGKTITLYIGYSAGGGYDTYARTIGRVIGKHIPGNPKIIAKYIKTGDVFSIPEFNYTALCS